MSLPSKKPVNYLNNKDILKEIHESKNSYCHFTKPEYLRPEKFNFPEGNWIKDFRRLWPAIQIISKASPTVSNEKNDVMGLVNNHLRRLRLFGLKTCIAAKVKS